MLGEETVTLLKSHPYLQLINESIDICLPKAMSPNNIRKNHYLKTKFSCLYI